MTSPKVIALGGGHGLSTSLQALRQITDQLVAEGLVERVSVEGDRRAFLVRLTPEGRAGFEHMAAQHEQWIVQAFEGLSPRELDLLHKLLGKVKQHQLGME